MIVGQNIKRHCRYFFQHAVNRWRISGCRYRVTNARSDGGIVVPCGGYRKNERLFIWSGYSVCIYASSLLTARAADHLERLAGLFPGLTEKPSVKAAIIRVLALCAPIDNCNPLGHHIAAC
jgi:hypothetical protein